MNNSATGGYLKPGISQQLPANLTLSQFIQSVIVGISGFSGPLVRPKWQVNPPKRPDVETNWIAYEVVSPQQDINAYVGSTEDGQSILARQQSLDIECAFYGPDALENITAFIDGFQIQQNLEAMRRANMGYKGFSYPNRIPDLFNTIWYNRFEMTLTLVRQVQTIYPVLSFASASGTIHTVLEHDYNTAWETPEETP